MKKIISGFARNTVFANIVFILILVAGGIAAISMIRENFPEFSLDKITISVVYPGADPEEVEEGISRKIEDAVDGVEGVKQYTTKASEGICTALIEVKEDFDVQDVLDRVRSKINAISTFPVDAEKPVINELTLKSAVSLIYLSGNMDEKRLKEWAERVRDEMKLLPDISHVSIYGVREYEIGIEISEERLREYGLTPVMVANAIRKSNLNLAGGTIRTKGEEIRVRTIGRKYTDKQLAGIVIMATPDGDLVTLDRIARIRDDFSEVPVYATINGKPAVMLIAQKTKEEDSILISEAVSKYVKKKAAELPPGLSVKILYDMTDMLRARINLLLKNGMIGLSVVFILLWMFLNVRLSFWAGMGIPISIAGALAVVWALGGTINMISLFGLIMVLGIIVDDAIVVGEAIFVHRKAGKHPLKAAIDGVSEVGMPVVAAVITTIAAFVPLMYVGGIMGKFIAIMPVVVISCLTVSLLECIFLLPAHLSHLPDMNRASTEKETLFRRLLFMNRITGKALERFVDRIYQPFIKKTLRWRYVALFTAISILILTFGLFKGGIIKFIVFPKVDGFVMTSTIKFPNGTPESVTRQAIEKIEAALLRLEKRTKTVSGEPMLEDRLTLVGSTLEEMPDSGSNVGSVQAILLDSEKRGIHFEKLMVEWEKEIGTIPGVDSLTFEGMAHGPPGAPIEIWFQGRDIRMLLAAADEMKHRLGKFDGVYQIRNDFTPGKNEVRLSLKPEARTLGITVEDVARRVYGAYFGIEALRIQRGRDDIRIRVRYTEEERRDLSMLSEIRVRTPAGNPVPLLSVADVNFSRGYSTISRTDGLRRVVVSAEVNSEKANTNEIMEELAKSYVPGLENRYHGLKVSFQGEKKRMRESLGSLYVGFPLAILAIFIIIATMFRSYIQPFIILLTVPFGIIGGIAGHLIMGYDVSMMSLFGMVALAGVVVNDAIVLIERYNENLAEGMRFYDAVSQACVRRFRAIVLTSVSTIGGLAPMIMETDFQARFLIPMAISIAGGVAFATVLTLVLIPSLLVILNDFRRIICYYRKGYWPSREEIEPATYRKKIESFGEDSEGTAEGQALPKLIDIEERKPNIQLN